MDRDPTDDGVTPDAKPHLRPEAGPFERRFGHPPGLAVLFMAEMWERMSYYGMRALLVLYMTDFLFATQRTTYSGGAKITVAGDPHAVVGLDTVRVVLERVFGVLTNDGLASQIYGLYTGFVYLTPILGGILADRYFGQRKTVVVGGAIMVVGQFVLMVDRLFFLGLLILILGNGLFKPNVSTQVGDLYPEGDPRKDRAYSVYYVGINVGAALGALVCGGIGQTYGWGYGFASAGVGMILGLVQYWHGQKYLAPQAPIVRKKDGVKVPVAKEPGEKGRIVALLVLCALNIVFWGVYEQQGNTMQLWADRNTNWPTLFGWTMPSTFFQAFNPLIIFTATPLLTALWAWQAKRKSEPSSITKMAIGCVILGASFLVMIAGARLIGDAPDAKGSLFWPFTCTVFLTIGELYLSPIGLSLVSKVAPRRMLNMMMGVWFLSSFFGNYMSGWLGTYYDRMPKSAFFGMLCALGIASGVAIFVVAPPLKKAVGHDV
ncbi:MAG: peptide MFS transporter [Polyangiaceae bacterium]